MSEQCEGQNKAALPDGEHRPRAAKIGGGFAKGRRGLCVGGERIRNCVIPQPPPFPRSLWWGVRKRITNGKRRKAQQAPRECGSRSGKRFRSRRDVPGWLPGDGIAASGSYVFRGNEKPSIGLMKDIEEIYRGLKKERKGRFFERFLFSCL